MLTQREIPAPLPDASIDFYPNFISPRDADLLYQRLMQSGVIGWRQDKITLFGRRLSIPRLHAWMGDKNQTYTYSGITLHPDPWIADLDDIREQLTVKLDWECTNVLLNHYRDGNDSMGWHRDNEPELGPRPLIASLSLGAPVVSCFATFIAGKTVFRPEPFI